MSTPALAPSVAPSSTPASSRTFTRTFDPSGPFLRLRIRTTDQRAVVDLTEQLEAFIVLTGLQRGLLAINTLHTTTAVVVNEQEPLLHGDVFRLLDRLAPCDLAYDHDDPARRVVNRVDRERTNGHAHCQAMLLGGSASVPIVGGRLLLGRWQRVLFVELDGPQERTVVATVAGGAP